MLASVQLLLRTVQSINLSEFRPLAIVRHQGAHEMMNRALYAECSTTNVEIHLVGALAGKGEAVIIADDVFHGLFAACSPSVYYRLPIHVDFVHLIEQNVNISRIALSFLFRSIRKPIHILRLYRLIRRCPVILPIVTALPPIVIAPFLRPRLRTTVWTGV